MAKAQQAPARLSESEIDKQLKAVPEWKRQGNQITRLYVFSDFVAAMAFVNHVADLAEKADHHPDIQISYRKVTLTLSSHDAGGLTAKDFALAKQIDA